MEQGKQLTLQAKIMQLMKTCETIDTKIEHSDAKHPGVLMHAIAMIKKNHFGVKINSTVEVMATSIDSLYDQLYSAVQEICGEKTEAPVTSELKEDEEK